MAGGGSRLELKVGLLIVVCAALLGGFLFLLSGWRRGETSLVEVDFDTSSGLKVGAAVRIAGMEAGRVEGVQFLGGKPDPATQRVTWVRVTLSLTPEMRATLRSDARFYITTAGLLGEKYIEIDPGAEAGPLPNAVAQGMPPMRLEVVAAQAQRALETVNAVLSENRGAITATVAEVKRTVELARLTLEDGRTFIGSASAALANLDTRGTRLLDVATKALSEYTPGVGDTGNDIRAAIQSGQRVLKGAETAVGDGRALEAVVAEAHAAVTDARGLMRNAGTQIESVSGAVKGVLGRADGVLQNGEGAIVAALDKVNQIIEDARVIATRIRRGEGTVGALLTDRELFDDARELMKDIKRHPWKVLWKE